MKKPELLLYQLGEGATAFSTTRNGGYSRGNYAEFNINRYCGDSEADISRNREALCRLLGIDDSRLIMPHQTHQTTVACIDDHFLTQTAAEQQQHLEGVDALTTDVGGVCIGVSTADCIPVLLYDEEHRAAGAIHAGWRGTVARIVSKTVAAMAATYGSRPERLRACIGPGIGLNSFEVGQEVYDAFCAAGFDMPTISRRQPLLSAPLSGEERWHIDLPECNRRQLVEAGLPAEAIQTAAVCTYKQHATFFSARRLGIQSGRIFTGIIVG